MTEITPVRADVMTVQTTPRPTPPSATVPFADVLTGGARALVRGAQAAMQTVPGASLMAVAVRGGASSASAGTPLSATVAASGATGTAALSNPEGPGGVTVNPLAGGTASSTGDGSIESTMAQDQQMNLYYLQIQEQVNAQNRTFTAMSNVMEVEHSTAKSILANVQR